MTGGRNGHQWDERPSPVRAADLPSITVSSPEHDRQPDLAPNQAPDSLGLLELGLRKRAGSVEQLAKYAEQPVAAVREELALLESWGYVSVRGDYITYRDPDHAAADHARNQLVELRSAMTDRIGQVASVLETLPQLLQLWSANSPEARGVIRADAFHGEDCVDLLWRSEKALHRPQRVDLILPDTGMVERPEAALDLFLGEAWTRVLAPATVVHGAYGFPDRVETRLLSSLPSWLLILEDEVVAMPTVWGEARPTSVMAVHDPALAMLASWIFERLWSAAVPATDQSHSWDQLMRLLAQGASLEAASRTLGISPRTGRRRLNDAMDHYRVDNQVALGVAWASSRLPRPRGSHS